MLDFLAGGIATFLKENNITQRGLYLGFTFPFAMEKESIDRAIIVSLSKNYGIQNAVGKNVCDLLQTALDKASTGVKCVAVVNDVRSPRLPRLLLLSRLIDSCLPAFGVVRRDAMCCL